MAPTVGDPPSAVEVASSLSALRALDMPNVDMHVAFAGALRWSGVPEVYAPPYFWAPRSREGDGALLKAARADAVAWADERLVWRQPWWRVDLAITDPKQRQRRM